MRRWRPRPPTAPSAEFLDRVGPPAGIGRSSGAQGLIGGLIAFVIPVLCLIPIGVASLLLPPSPVADTLLLVVSLLWAGGLLATGVVLGGRRLDARAPEMLEQLRRAEI